MKQLIDFIQAPEKIARDVDDRWKSKTEDVIAISKEFGFDYWDGDRIYGYGGYKYDSRWQKVAERLVSHYKLKENYKVLDVGCGKGFLVKDLLDTKFQVDAYGIDISEYALRNSFQKLSGRLHFGSAVSLPFPDNSFDLVVSFNTLHNLKRSELIESLTEIERVTKGPSFVQVDSYTNEREKEIFLKWVLTAEFHDYTKGWFEVFDEAKFTGDYFWTIIR